LYCKNIFISFILAALAAATAKAQELSKPIWEVRSLAIPESVLHSAKENMLYVSLVDGAGNVKDGKGGVALLNLDGSIKDVKWIENLNAPKG
jgi:hypothetical protein